MSIEKRPRPSPNDCGPGENDGARAKLYRDVREHARSLLTDENRHTTKLYQDDRAWRGGEVIRLPFQKIKVRQPSVLVFADDKPWANYGHECRYLFYDARTAKLIAEVPALFPPYLNRSARGLRLIHDMTKRGEPTPLAPPAPLMMQAMSGGTPAPLPVPAGKRYALLFQGGNQATHMNDLELSYRTLVQHYLFDPADIVVLSGDGTLKDSDGNVPLFPGSPPSAFTMTINKAGTRQALLTELDNLAQKVTADDLVFIHLSGHGSPDGASGSDAAPDAASIVCFNLSDPILTQHLDADEFEEKLGKFEHHRDLLVLMAQCYAGGFIPGIKRATKATRTHVSAAARFDAQSANAPGDKWPVFSHAWITAQLDQDPDADHNNDGAIQASEAYRYARLHKDEHDKPAHGQKGSGASKITLGAGLPVAYSWRKAIGPSVQDLFESHGVNERTFAALRTAMPDVQDLVFRAIKESTAALRAELTPRIDAIFAAAFGGGANGRRRRKRPGSPQDTRDTR